MKIAYLIAVLTLSFVLLDPTGSGVNAQLLLHVPFDRDTIVADDVHDVSGNGFLGVIIGDVDLTSGVAGEAVEFVGSDVDYVDFGDEDEFDPEGDSFSVSVWFDADPAGGAEFVVSKGNAFSGGVGWSIWMEQDNVHVRGQQVDATNADRFGMFESEVDPGIHHVVMVLDREDDVILGYLDGEAMLNPGGGGAQTDLLIPDSEIFADAPLLVGRRVTDGAPLTGWVDDLQIYRQALNDVEVAFLFDNPGKAIVQIAPGDYNNDGTVDIADIDLQAQAMKDPDPDLTIFDENGNVVVETADRRIWVKQHAKTWYGDANLDREFSSGDLVKVFAAGMYENGKMAGWADGDWDGNMAFDSSDLVIAFADGGYELGPPPAAAAVPEPNGLMMIHLVLIALATFARQKRRN